MDLSFALRGLSGRVTVDVQAHDRPELFGAAPGALGFPYCDAVVDYPARGYDAILGWVQLVRSDDNRSGGAEYEIDPLDFLGDLPHPFCWIGLEPHLFDSPWRAPRRDLDWRAHSFLCVPDSSDGGGNGGLEVHALLGFSWGFCVRDEQITVERPAVLAAVDWDAHLAMLAATYPAWTFVEGFRADSPASGGRDPASPPATT